MSYNDNFSLFDSTGARKYLNQTERIQFYNVSKSKGDEKRLFAHALLWSGARISEIISLNVHQLNLTKSCFIVECLKKRKKGVFREIPIPAFFCQELQTYINSESISTRIWTKSRSTYSRYIKEIMNDSGIKGIKACSKGVRHSFGISCAMNNIPQATITKWMGHSSISVTAIYMNVMGKEERLLAQRLWEGVKN